MSVGLVYICFQLLFISNIRMVYVNQFPVQGLIQNYNRARGLTGSSLSIPTG
ncbi:hypothetical protein HanXRQr2_Chr09g0409851 [Helianthus annuus]|uniref:Uncharacterized protein n=1 Tax=Helianthus annuus TaxID=4232 RepID=A0A9K3IAS8_HELAN|nr:hypothetical protein HanXRQr2_Chr09g0409851 [Helianthus annuus]